jgi:hypothetical protein
VHYAPGVPIHRVFSHRKSAQTQISWSLCVRCKSLRLTVSLLETARNQSPLGFRAADCRSVASLCTAGCPHSFRPVASLCTAVPVSAQLQVSSFTVHCGAGVCTASGLLRCPHTYILTQRRGNGSAFIVLGDGHIALIELTAALIAKGAKDDTSG